MTKRIVSGIFILTALGALGVILAGALTSGEQLIVRFLTAVIVAALGLYVISDLRLQANDDANGVRSTGRARLAGIDAPPNSTAAFMATVTRRGTGKSGTPQAVSGPDAPAEDERIEPHDQGVGATSSSTSEQQASAVVEDAGSPDGPPIPSVLGPAPVTVRSIELPELTARRAETGRGLLAPHPDEATGERSPIEEPSWPSTEPIDDLPEDRHAGVPCGDPSAAPGGDDGRDAHPFPAGSSQLFDDTNAGVDREPADEEPADEEPTEDEPTGATVDTELCHPDFTYSGEIDVPDLQWPAAPEHPERSGRPDPDDGPDDGEVAGQPAAADAPDIATSTPDPVEADDQIPNQADDEIPTIVAAHQIDLAPDADTLGPASMPDVDIGIQATEWFRGGSPSEGLVADDEPGQRHDHGPIEGVPEPIDDSSAEVVADEPVENGPVDGASEEPLEEPEPVSVNGTHRPLPSPFLGRASRSAADYADAPLAPIIDLRDVASTTGSGIESAIRAGEIEVVAALIEQGMLSTEGPISDRDVRTMVYVAFTSNELRKLLLAGGSPKGPNPGIDLGPVELFSEGIEAPKRVYPGLPMQSAARSQLG